MARNHEQVMKMGRMLAELWDCQRDSVTSEDNTFIILAERVND